MVAKNFNLTNNIYIPETIFLKFCDNDRDDTIDGRLSFPSYFKTKTKVAHEKAMSRWGNNKIPTKNIENKPKDGYIINLSIARSSDWSSSGRSMLRIYSPDEFEFEISIENFCYICEYADISKKYINCELILGFSGGKIILIPTQSPLYEQAKKDTDIINGVVHISERKKELTEHLFVGETYTSNYSNYLYLGEVNTPKMKHTHFIKDRYISHVINSLTAQNYEILGVNLKLFNQGGIKSIYNDISTIFKTEHLVISHQDTHSHENRIKSLTLTQIKKMELKEWDNEEMKRNFFGKNNFNKDGTMNLQKVFYNADKRFCANNYIEVKKNIDFEDLRSLYNDNPEILQLNYRTINFGEPKKQLTSFSAFTSEERIIHITKEKIGIDNNSKKTSILISVYIGERAKKIKFKRVKEFIFLAEDFIEHNFLGKDSKIIELDWADSKSLTYSEVQMLMHPINIMKNVEEYIFNETFAENAYLPKSEHMVMLTTTNNINGKKILIILDNTLEGNINEIILGDRI